MNSTNFVKLNLGPFTSIMDVFVRDLGDHDVIMGMDWLGTLENDFFMNVQDDEDGDGYFRLNCR